MATINFIIRGQSNANLFGNEIAGTWSGTSETGAQLLYSWASTELASQSLAVPSATIIPTTYSAINGIGLEYNTNLGTTSATGGWLVGNDATWSDNNIYNPGSGYESAFETSISTLSATHTFEIYLWNEYDAGVVGNDALASGSSVSQARTGYENAIIKDMTDTINALDTHTPGQKLTYVFVAPIPFWTDQSYGTGDYPGELGEQIIKQAMQAIVTGAVTLPSGVDAIMTASDGDMNMNSGVDSSAGIYEDSGIYGGAHLSTSDIGTLAFRIGTAVANYIADSPSLDNSSDHFDVSGPQVTSATLDTSDSLFVWVSIPAGLTLDALSTGAANGLGWSVHQGSSVFYGTSASIISNNSGTAELKVTFNTNQGSTAPGTIGNAGVLYYEYGIGNLAVPGGATLGSPSSGDAVEDAFSMPLGASPSGVAISATNAGTAALQTFEIYNGSSWAPDHSNMTVPTGMSAAYDETSGFSVIGEAPNVWIQQTLTAGNALIETSAGANDIWDLNGSNDAIYSAASGTDFMFLESSTSTTPGIYVNNFHAGDEIEISGPGFAGDWTSSSVANVTSVTVNGTVSSQIQIEFSPGTTAMWITLMGVSESTAQGHLDITDNQSKYLFVSAAGLGTTTGGSYTPFHDNNVTFS
jgi:hypothetical protein